MKTKTRATRKGPIAKAAGKKKKAARKAPAKKAQVRQGASAGKQLAIPGRLASSLAARAKGSKFPTWKSFAVHLLSEDEA